MHVLRRDMRPCLSVCLNVVTCVRVCLSVCLYVRPSVRTCIRLLFIVVCLSTRLLFSGLNYGYSTYSKSVHLCFCLSVCLSVRPSVRPSAHPSVSVCLSVCLCLSVRPSVRMGTLHNFRFCFNLCMFYVMLCICLVVHRFLMWEMVPYTLQSFTLW